MSPILLRLGPITLYTYGLLMAVGVAFGLWFLTAQAKRQGLNPSRVFDAAFYILLVSILGAKLILLFTDFERYTRHPRELFTLARSGGVFQGGLVFGLVFALLYFRKHKLPTWTMADLIAPALALGHGFGRVGCFFAGCCYGRECSLPWAVTVHDNDLTGIPLGTPLHPVQLYEAGLNFLNFFLLFLILRKKKFDGQIFSLYIAFYSVIRLFTEFFRGDHPERAFFIEGRSAFSSISYPQLFSLIGIAGGIALFFIFKRRNASR